VTYHWPVKPFHRQHPVRGYLNDPRIFRQSRSFHFGVDISAPDGASVFAVEAGTAFAQPRHVTVVVSGGRRMFGYWHVVPVVHDRQTVAARELLGHVVVGKGHVHFAEKSSGRYRNPLRRGALTPYEDDTSPAVDDIVFLRDGSVVPAAQVRGRVDVSSKPRTRRRGACHRRSQICPSPPPACASGSCAPERSSFHGARSSTRAGHI
jgi:hypothetical protein